MIKLTLVYHMRNDILSFFKQVLPKYKLSLNYLPSKDIMFIHYRGWGILTITTEIFYQIPKKDRERHFLPLLKRGLAQNLGEKQKDNLAQDRRIGKLLIK